MTWDCEYGNYADMNNDVSFFDNFFPSKEAREKARKKYDEALMDILEDIAYENHVPPYEYKEWDSEDWDRFREAMDI